MWAVTFFLCFLDVGPAHMTACCRWFPLILSVGLYFLVLSFLEVL